VLEPDEDFGTQLFRYIKRKEMDLEDLAQGLQALGYSRESVHPGRMLNATTDREGYRWRNNPVVLKGIKEVLSLSNQEMAELIKAYLYRPPDRPRRRRR
jgi:hypothetical protein